MKKLTTLVVLACISTILSLTSCGSKGMNTSIIQAYYLGAMHTFNSANGMYIYQSANDSSVIGAEPGTGSTASVTFQGANTGTYSLGTSSTGSLSLTIGNKTYSSFNYGSHGTLNITDMNSSTMVAKGNFNGTLYTNTLGDSLPVTQGLISVRYQF